jgi:hypothetical protein
MAESTLMIMIFVIVGSARFISRSAGRRVQPLFVNTASQAQ